MHFYFNPFPLFSQYQPYYEFNPQIIVNATQLHSYSNLQKISFSRQKQIKTSLELQNVQKLTQFRVDQVKKIKKTKKIEDKNFGFRDQDKERNIFSNILKGFLFSLTQKRTMDSLIGQSCQRYSVEMETKSVLQKIMGIFSKCKSYFSPKSIRSKLTGPEGDNDIKKIVKICLFHYLKTQFPMNLLLSNRIKRKSKLLQMKKARELISIFQGCQ